MEKTEVKKNNKMIPIKSKAGVIELYPVETVIAVALQNILGTYKTISSVKR